MSSKQARALIVEDDRSWQQILGEILGDVGLAVDVTDNFAEAAQTLRAHPHRIAVIDLALGAGDYNSQDGIRVLDTIRRHDPGCVPIMLTGFATVELAVDVLTHHGAFSCLRKENFDRTEFRDLIERALISAPASPGRASGGAPGQAGTDTAASDRNSRPPFAQTVLVVEDDAGWRGILDELLQDAGYKVRLCSSFGEALGRLRREAYQLAIVDLSLAGITPETLTAPSTAPILELEGYQLLSTTREQKIPTIVVSGMSAPEDIERTYTEQGIFAYLEKQTFNRRAFLDTVAEAQALHNQTSVSLDALTTRELEVLELLARGMTNKEIASTLFITTNTVKRHVKAIFSKLEVHTRAAAAATAVNAGMPAETTETTTLPNRQHPV